MAGGRFVIGTIMAGLDEGAYFLSMAHYKKEIKSKLEFDAYPGTLNIKINEKKSNLFKKLNSIKIDGYTKNNKLYGSATCYKAKISNINGSIIIPDINKHKEDIIEFIAPIHVKSKLKLRDGDKIKIELL